MRAYNCPVCDEEIEHKGLDTVQCGTCMTWLTLDEDAEFDNGHWHDLSSWITLDRDLKINGS